MKTILRWGAILMASWIEVTAAPMHKAELIFPLELRHNHGSCIVEAPNGSLIVCWFHGSGERQADDVLILGARLDPETGEWSAPFVMADTPEFPDTNCCMIIDPEKRLWLFWPTILANLWESALMKYKVSRDYQSAGQPPRWELEKVLHMKPGLEFERIVREKTSAYLSHRELSPEAIEWADHNFSQAADKLTLRLGWFTRAHPYVTSRGRLIIGLYSDGFSFSCATYTDDWGESWRMSEPIVGGGNIQPSFARKRDGTLVAYMRDNGPPPKRVHVAASHDDAQTWGPVRDHPVLPNPGSGLELMNLADGRFLVVYNDIENGRHRLAVSISDDEGETFRWTRHLERSEPGTGSYHYPSVIQASDGTLHCTYSYFVTDPLTKMETKSIKHAAFNIDWVERGDGR